MAYDNSQGKESLFNEAVSKVQRIHDSQNRINAWRTNPLKYSVEDNKYGYQIIITELLSICKECLGKMNKVEEDMFFRWRDVMQGAVDVLVVWDNQTSHSLDGSKIRKSINQKNWTTIRTLINAFEDYTNKVEERTEYGGASKTDPTRAVVQS